MRYFLAALLSIPACWAALDSYEAVKAEWQRCRRSPSFKGVRSPGDLNATFEPILNGEAFAELSPKVVSTDPWIVFFENFMTEDEVTQVEQNVFAEREATFDKSPAGGSGTIHHARHSETSFCTGSCDVHPALQTVRGRASSIVKVPPENFDFTQALRYKEGMFYKNHQDNHPTFHLLPCGPRIFTFLVYLSDVESGGGTRFPSLDVATKAKRGAAVLFVNTKDDDPMVNDDRAYHEAITVEKGEKRCLNLWLYQFDFKHFWKQSCTSIELADALGKFGLDSASDVELPPPPPAPKFVVDNGTPKAVQVLWVGQNGEEVPLGAVQPGSTSSWESHAGHVFRVRLEDANGPVLEEYTVKGDGGEQTIRLNEGHLRTVAEPGASNDEL